jgi:hypothetical protein
MAFNGKMELNARIILRDKEWWVYYEDKSLETRFQNDTKNGIFLYYMMKNGNISKGKLY